jgi:hypothetical protein
MVGTAAREDYGGVVEGGWVGIGDGGAPEKDD